MRKNIPKDVSSTKLDVTGGVLNEFYRSTI